MIITGVTILGVSSVKSKSFCQRQNPAVDKDFNIMGLRRGLCRSINDSCYHLFRHVGILQGFKGVGNHPNVSKSGFFCELISGYHGVLRLTFKK